MLGALGVRSGGAVETSSGLVGGWAGAGSSSAAGLGIPRASRRWESSLDMEMKSRARSRRLELHWESVQGATGSPAHARTI